MKLLEGIDYILENGRMVLSKEFLLKRGYCCNSKCRNCPYKFSNDNIYDVISHEEKEKS